MVFKREIDKKNSAVYSNLSEDLKKQYNKRSVSVIKGDTVKIMRGEYKGVEGKVEKINSVKGRLSIEGVQREKIKGGQVKVQIHASNVIISSLKLDDDYRKNKIENKNNNSKVEKDGNKSDKK
jgi:large subunit ribosomal protein L24